LNKRLSFIGILIVLAAASYFFRYSIELPKALIISILISVFIVAFLLSQKSSAVKPVGGLLLIVNMVWFIGNFIPVYDQVPDIRPRYYAQHNTLFSFLDTTGLSVQITHAGVKRIATFTDLIDGEQVYPTDLIENGALSNAGETRLLLGFRDGSDVQLLGQTRLHIDTLAPDFTMLSGSAIQMTLLQ